MPVGTLNDGRMYLNTWLIVPKVINTQEATSIYKHIGLGTDND